MQASTRPKQSSGKGRAQLMNEDRIKCSRPGGNHTPDGNNLPGGNNIPGGDYRTGGSGIFVENSWSVSNQPKQAYLEFYQ